MRRPDPPLALPASKAVMPHSLTFGFGPEGQFRCTCVVRNHRTRQLRGPSASAGGPLTWYFSWWRGQDLNLRPSGYEPRGFRSIPLVLGCVRPVRRPRYRVPPPLSSAPVCGRRCLSCSRCVRAGAVRPATKAYTSSPWAASSGMRSCSMRRGPSHAGSVIRSRRLRSAPVRNGVDAGAPCGRGLPSAKVGEA